jgi:hypothetical protein
MIKNIFENFHVKISSPNVFVGEFTSEERATGTGKAIITK